MKGTLITTQTPMFKQNNKISQKPTYPIFLNELEIINHIQIDHITPTELKERKRKRKTET